MWHKTGYVYSAHHLYCPIISQYLLFIYMVSYDMVVPGIILQSSPFGERFHARARWHARKVFLSRVASVFFNACKITFERVFLNVEMP